MSGLRAASAPVTAQLTVPTYNATGALLVARSRGPRQQMSGVRAGAVAQIFGGVVVATTARADVSPATTKFDLKPLYLLLSTPSLGISELYRH